MSEYKKYLHVERLGSEECEGLLDNDTVYVTAKVDGSNGCVYWSEKAGRVMVGSRNFELSDAEDNAYFYAWMKSGADEAKLLCAYCAAHPTRIVYGEWMGRDRFIGAFKGYDKAALGKLLIFDVYDTTEERFLGEPEWRDELSASGLEPYFIKLLAVLDHPTLDDVVAVAKTNDFLLEGTDAVGEGVVCKVPGWKNRFGHTAYGKVVLDEFVKQRKSASKSVDVELEIVNGYMTDAELEKTVAKVCTMVNADSFDPESRKMMGMFTSMCWKDLLIECPNWVKRMKNPTVDFGKLAGLCNARAKEHVKASGQ